MAPLALAFGLLLGILGAGFYYWTEMVSMTALIPAYFGLALILLGLVGMSAKWRMHALHVAALVGLFGLGIPAYRVAVGYARGTEMKPYAVVEQLTMAGLCGAFLILCIKSFIDARRRRKSQGV